MRGWRSGSTGPLDDESPEDDDEEELSIDVVLESEAVEETESLRRRRVVTLGKGVTSRKRLGRGALGGSSGVTRRAV